MSIMMSIRPEWTQHILRGGKTIEIRKTRPKVPPPFTVYIYETKGNGKGRGAVIGKFLCSSIQTIYDDSDIQYGIDHPNDYGKKLMRESGMTLWEMREYLGGKDGCYWRIDNLKIYDEPKALWEFSPMCRHTGECGTCKNFNRGDWTCEKAQFKRPPQSWAYVEALIE